MDEQLLKSVADLEKKCTDVGITPLELYMRQNGLCRLVLEEGILFCTDGEDKALTEELANPTAECSRCFTRFVTRLNDEDSKSKAEE